MDEIEFSDSLEQALSEVYPSNDPLDLPNFDVISYINSKFPDEQSLSGGNLSTYNDNLTKEIKLLQKSNIIRST